MSYKNGGYQLRKSPTLGVTFVCVKIAIDANHHLTTFRSLPGVSVELRDGTQDLWGIHSFLKLSGIQAGIL